MLTIPAVDTCMTMMVAVVFVVCMWCDARLLQKGMIVWMHLLRCRTLCWENHWAGGPGDMRRVVWPVGVLGFVVGEMERCSLHVELEGRSLHVELEGRSLLAECPGWVHC